MANSRIGVQNVAEDIRIKFEQKKIPREELARLYSKYNSQVCLETFVTEAEKLFPALNCGLTTVYLQEMLGGEIIQGQYKGNDHTYLLLDNEVIDITADQYGGPKVYVGELKSPWAQKQI